MVPGEDLPARAAAPTVAARAGTPIRLPNLAKPIGKYPSIWHGFRIQRAMATVSQSDNMWHHFSLGLGDNPP